MNQLIVRSLLSVITTVTLLASPIAVSLAFGADPCQSAIVKSLAKYKKAYLRSHAKCLDRENKGLLLPNSCPDAYTAVAIGKASATVKTKIAAACTLSQIQALGYQSDCAYAPAVVGIEGQCAALPVTSTDEFAQCMQCWKGAELSEFMAILHASRAVEECGGDLGETSPNCSELECSTPLPVQRLLGDTAENDCQAGIAKAGIKYLLKREKILENCLLKGCTQAQCLGATCEAAVTAPVQLEKAEMQKIALITKKCGNRAPSTSLPGFCCRCGQGNQCMDISDRAACEATPGCAPQDGKVCNLVDLTCDTGPKTITWWDNCPESTTDTCPGDPVTTLNELIACVDTSAVAITDELLCFQFPGYPCPSVTTTTMP